MGALAAAGAAVALMVCAAGTERIQPGQVQTEMENERDVSADVNVSETEHDLCVSETGSGGEAGQLILTVPFPEPEKEGGEKPPVLTQTLSLLPQRWYAGDYGKKPVVKSQGKYGTCWALTATSAMEAALLPQEHMVFSADHLTRNNAFTVDVDDGGDYLMTMAYLSGWQGPVTEEEDPYGDEYSPDGLQPSVHVQEIQVLDDASAEEIKSAVYACGAVQTSLYMNRETTAADSSYYNKEKTAYYDPLPAVPNHDVLILGWDDSFSRFYFRQTPPVDGAWICQNTWGGEFGTDGIFYVSYADANIGQMGIVYSRIESADNYDRIYQTDECGWQGKQGYDNGTCWFANVYTAQESERLSAFGFYATARDTSYELYVVRDFSGVESFADRQFLQSGSMEHIGYYTVDLRKPVSLNHEEQFAVVVKITSSADENPVAVEYRADEYTMNVTTEGKEGYLSQYGNYWENTEERFGTNVCLKAYTKLCDDNLLTEM